MKGRTVAPIIGVIIIFVVGLLAISTVEYWHRSKPVVHPRNISNRGLPISLTDDGWITEGWVDLEIAGAGKLRIEVIEITYGNVAQFHIDGFHTSPRYIPGTSVELPYSMILAIQLMASVRRLPDHNLRVRIAGTWFFLGVSTPAEMTTSIPVIWAETYQD